MSLTLYDLLRPAQRNVARKTTNGVARTATWRWAVQTSQHGACHANQPRGAQSFRALVGVAHVGPVAAFTTMVAAGATTSVEPAVRRWSDPATVARAAWRRTAVDRGGGPGTRAGDAGTCRGHREPRTPTRAGRAAPLRW